MSTQKDDKPLVTLMTLVYNNAEYVLPALAHLKDQLYRPVEHIIVDDCSTDDSATVIQRWITENNYDCNFIRHEKNRGICGTINEIILSAKGKYIYGVSDDFMEPYKLVKDVDYLEAHPEAAYCTSNMVHRYHPSGREETRKYSEGGNQFRRLLDSSLTIATPTAIYRTQVLKDIGLFDESLLFEDYDMFLRLLHKYPAGYRDDYSVIYNVHPKSIQAVQEIKFHDEFFSILKKWRYVRGYRYYRFNRHQLSFCYFAVKNKKEALRHLLPALTVFWHMRLYKGLFRFLFVWKK